MGFLKSAVLVLIVAIGINLLPRFFTSTPEASMDGFVAPGYQKVADVFRENLESGLEKGAAFSVFHNGEMVVNLVGGYADEEASVPWEKNTLTIFNSVSKGLGAMSIAMLVDRGLMDYNKPVAHYWPEFGQNGKEDILVKHLVSHQAGLEALDEPIKFQWLVTDPSNTKLAPILAAQKARGKPGSGQMGYHALTYGLYVDELIRRVDPKHRTMQQFIKEEIADKLGLDLFLGLPKEEFYRAARLRDLYYSTSIMQQMKYIYSIFSDPLTRTAAMKYAGGPDSLAQRAMLPDSDVILSAVWMNRQSFREAPCTSVTGHATAAALAKLYGTLAMGGTEPTKGVKLMSQQTVKTLMTPLVSGEEDCYGVPFNLTYGLFAKTNPLGGEIYGSAGLGGQMAWADPKNKLGWAYITNHFNLKSDMVDNRYLTLYKALYDVIQQK